MQEERFPNRGLPWESVSQRKARYSPWNRAGQGEGEASAESRREREAHGSSLFPVGKKNGVALRII